MTPPSYLVLLVYGVKVVEGKGGIRGSKSHDALFVPRGPQSVFVLLPSTRTHLADSPLIAMCGPAQHPLDRPFFSGNLEDTSY